MVSSGATMPARAPASIDMLQTVSRPSIDRPRIVEPAYSITCPVAPAVPMRAMMARITSFAVTPGANAPSTAMRIVLGLRCHSACAASTWQTSVMPMPKASAPSAPWVEVWLSGQTSRRPGWLSPVSGPTTCTMPCRSLFRSNSSKPYSAASRVSASTMARLAASGIAATSRVSVGT